MPATQHPPKSISQEVRELMDGLTPDQIETFLAEFLEVMACDPKEYGSLNDYRVETIEMLVDLRDGYEQLAGAQLDVWERESRFHARSEYREAVIERRAA